MCRVIGHVCKRKMKTMIPKIIREIKKIIHPHINLVGYNRLTHEVEVHEVVDAEALEHEHHVAKV
jgi:hypothetical protein